MPQQYDAFPTGQNVVDAALSECLGSTTSSLTALQPKALSRQIDIINKTFVNEAHMHHHAGGWSWMEAWTNFQTIADVTLNGALTTASTSVILTSGTGFDTGAGQIWCQTAKGAIDHIPYASLSGSVASGAIVHIAHAASDKVGKEYALPTDYAKAKTLMMDTVRYDLMRNSLLPYWRTYYSYKGFFVVPQGTGAHDATLYYEKKPQKLFTSTSSVDNSSTDLGLALDIPEDFLRYAVEMLKGHIFTIRRKFEYAEFAFAEARGSKYPEELGGILSLALNYDANEKAFPSIYSNW